jgi:hypothetical protein
MKTYLGYTEPFHLHIRKNRKCPVCGFFGNDLANSLSSKFGGYLTDKLMRVWNKMGRDHVHRSPAS